MSESKRILTKKEVYKYVGDPYQLFGIKDYRFISGRAVGVRAIDVKNGSGLEFTVLADRALDIYLLSYKGINISYISKSGIVSPQYNNNKGFDSQLSFFGGMLTTCGLDNVGKPCFENGEEFGLHGSISGIPANEVYAGTDWVDGRAVMTIEGKVGQSRFYNGNILMQRKLSSRYGDNTIRLCDTFDNNGHKTEPFMLLYHINFGFPFLSGSSRIILPVNKTIPRDKNSARFLDSFDCLVNPGGGFIEQVYFHDLIDDGEGRTYAGIINSEMELGFIIRFNKKKLHRLIEWKQMGFGEYVVGLEPTNCEGIDGRVEERKNGRLQFIEPGESKEIDLTFEVLDGHDEISLFLEKEGVLEWKNMF